MNHGLSDHVVGQINGVFSQWAQIKRAVLYGSRAKGTYKRGSDIDLVLYGDGLVPEDLAKIEDQLDDLFLPYEIDLSIFHCLDHDELKAHIHRVGVVFYPANSESQYN